MSTPVLEAQTTPASLTLEDEELFAKNLPYDATEELGLIFFKCCIANYKQMDRLSDTPSESFADDISAFTTEDFTNVPSNGRASMRDLLRTRGVYVRKGSGVTIANALFKVVKKDIPWPKNEKSEHIDENKTKQWHENKESRKGTWKCDSKQGAELSRRESILKIYNSKSRYNGIINLLKSYHYDSFRYSYLSTENLDHNLCLFGERCDRAFVPNNEKSRAFSILLTGYVRDFHFDNLKGKDYS